MKFFVRQKQKQSVNPQSQAFVNEVKAMLEERGVSDEKKRGQCQFYLFQTTIKFYKAIARGEEADVERLAGDMKKTLSEYGITEQDQQEEIILKYFMTLNKLGEQHG